MKDTFIGDRKDIRKIKIIQYEEKKTFMALTRKLT